MTTHPPKESFEQLCELGTDLLQRVIAIDSQSDERSDSIPSTEGQKHLSATLEQFFSGLGFTTMVDENANLLAEIPGNVTGNRPKLAFMVHIDTAEGTRCVPSLETARAWDGGAVPYPQNSRLQVSVDLYPETGAFVGHDLLFGPGERPVGFDDKLGMSEMMTLAHILARNPEAPRPDIVMVARPDEEIGRMAAVEGLADELQRRGVTHGYTVDGIQPFEINTENFHAARAVVTIEGQPLTLAPVPAARVLTLQISGAKSHGATAKAEGYLNATMIGIRAVPAITDEYAAIPIGFASDATAETNAVLRFALRGANDSELDRTERELLARFDSVLAPHAYKGAELIVRERQSVAGDSVFTDEVIQLFHHLRDFLRIEGPSPLLSEDSEGYEGYSNPCFVKHDSSTIALNYRLRDFTTDGLSQRKAHVQDVCRTGVSSIRGGLPVVVEDQYVNMGPALAPYPELVSWAERAAQAAGVASRRAPIRGGTGVDPFLQRGIPIANVGTGYFAPESEKELTSRQMLGKHVIWLYHLVQVVATHE